MQITPAQTTDFLAIAELDREAWKDNNHAEFIPDGEHVWRIWVEHALVFCAKQESEIIGAILAFPTKQNQYCTHKVFVRKDYREKGIGSALFKALLSEIDALKAMTFLTVDPANQSALALYEKWGFTSREFVKGFYREQEDRYVLSRQPS